MKNGYKVIWTDEAIKNLDSIIDYLISRWTDNEVKNFAKKLERRIDLITKRPQIFPLINKRTDTRRSIISRHITIYYTVSHDYIKIVTLFDTRQDPSKLEI
jgi:plasmid stabilization system protein ParE